MIKESEMENEFRDILKRLYILSNKTEMKTLMKKASQNKLTKLEKNRFIELSANIKILKTQQLKNFQKQVLLMKLPIKELN